MPEAKSRTRAAVAAIDDVPPLAPPRVMLFARALLRVVARRPTDSIGGLVAASLASMIAWNALFGQTGPHPAPLMAPAKLPAPAAKETTGVLTPRARPAEVAAPAAAADDKDEGKRTRLQLITDIQRELLRRGFYEGAVDGAYGPRMDAAIREFEQAAGLRQSGEPTETLLKTLVRSPVKAERKPAAGKRTEARTDTTGGIPAAPSRRIVAVQRGLTEFGYGQLKLTGVFDEPTKAAVEKFERERKLPVRGQLTDRVLRELAAVTGRPFAD